jgi:hypothetical protein
VKRPLWFAALALALAPFSTSPAVAANKVTPLFAEDSTLQVKITGPLKTLQSKAKFSTDLYNGTIEANGETLPIQLQARGLSRRTSYACQFPPLRVIFPNKPPANSLFKGQTKLKLVVHCRDQDKYEQYTLREYAAYRLFNVLTPLSFKVRLAHLTYFDGDKQLASRYGFFIEDEDDMAERNGKAAIKVERIPSSALDPTDAARTSLFQYMIANFDWEMLAGPKGTNCCHNDKLIAATEEARTSITPVPYDFDYTGLVNPPYAEMPPSWSVTGPRDRYYWGVCRTNDEVLRLAPEFLAARPALEKTIADIPGLTPANRDDILKWFGGFWNDISSPAMIQKNVLKTCR